MRVDDSIERADKLSRKRPIGTAAATIIFLAVQPFTHPGIGRLSTTTRSWTWVLNVAVLLLLLLPAVGFIWGRRVRQLVNDDVARLNARTGMVAGFWIAMVAALGLFALPVSSALSARDALYFVVTPATGVALLSFAWLEWRANRDG